MLKSLGVPLNKTEILDDAVGLDEEDIDENMKGNEEILKINEKIEQVKNPNVIRREDYVVYDALIRGECTHPGCNCVEFKFGVRERRVCRTCKHKNKFHKPPKAKVGLKPTNVVTVKKHVFKDEIQESLEDDEFVGRKRRRIKLANNKKQKKEGGKSQDATVLTNTDSETEKIKKE